MMPTVDKVEEGLLFARRLAMENQRIAAHACLEMVYREACIARPRMVMEIGTGVNGLRTKVLCKAASLFDAEHISVDILDCSKCGNAWYPKWSFIQGDGRHFAKHFGGMGLPTIDLLSIDTDERYDTTLALWNAWRPFLSRKATVMFRCTNLKKRLVYKDGRTTGLGWDNERGVIRVLEGFFATQFDETVEFETWYAGWTIKHIPWGAGLTVLRRPA